MRTVLLILFSLFYVVPGMANVEATVFWYQEKEQNMSVTKIRYLVTDQFIRIDEGQADDDFILFDVTKKTIYSVNHDDHTILEIKNQDWTMPEFDFKREVVLGELKDAPSVAGKTVKRYLLTANDEVCMDIQYLPGTYPDEMRIFHQYQLVLSGQQVVMINNTPQEMQSPCFLLDQVYDDGDYYNKGLPIQLWHSRGYARLLVDFKKEHVPAELFFLPSGYSMYEPVIH